MSDYEAHITLDIDFQGNREATLVRLGTLIGEVLGVPGIGWKYSCIDGDPVFGKGARSYLTAHSASRDTLVEQGRLIVARLVGRPGFTVRRLKVKDTVFDERY